MPSNRASDGTLPTSGKISSAPTTDNGTIGTPVRSGGRDEPAPAEALELVAVGERLADPLEPLGPDSDQLPAGQHPLGVLVAGEGGAALAGQAADQRHPEDQVGAERPEEAAGLVVDRHHRHQAVDRQRAGVVRDDECPALGREVLDATHLDAEPLLRDRTQAGQQQPLGDLLVEAVLVDGVVAGQPPPEERQEPSELRLPVVAEHLDRARTGTPPATRRARCPPRAHGPRSSRRGRASATAATSARRRPAYDVATEGFWPAGQRARGGRGSRACRCRDRDGRRCRSG